MEQLHPVPPITAPSPAQKPSPAQLRPIPFAPPNITQGDIDAVAAVLRSGWITTGPKTQEFQDALASFCGLPIGNMVCLNSATAALELALRTLGIGPGDEVILPAYTYTATAAVVCHVGAKPVLVDSLPNSYHISPQQVANAITHNTKAIISVDIGGAPCDYPALYSTLEAKRYLFMPQGSLQKALGRPALIADAAHSLGAAQGGKASGRLADFTAFSFHAVKNLTTAEGGALCWQSIQGVPNKSIYSSLMLLALHGQTKDALAKTVPGAWQYDILMPGYKCNMTDISAALGLAQLGRYRQNLLRRHKLIKLYNSYFASSGYGSLAHLRQGERSSGHLYMLQLTGRSQKFRDTLIAHLGQNGIAANVHYRPLPMLTAYKQLGFAIENYPNAHHLYKQEITLPLYPQLQEEDVARIANLVVAF